MFSPEMHRKGVAQLENYIAWSILIDHATWGRVGQRYWGEPKINTKTFFQPSQLFKEELWWPKSSLQYLKSAKEFAKKPPLYLGKFPKYRKIVLPEELGKKLKEEY